MKRLEHPATGETTTKRQPTYRRIQISLRERVQSGEWKNGEALPSRTALAEEFGTTRITVEKAVRELEREGVLQSVHGRGTFVAPLETSNSEPTTVLSAHKTTFTLGILQGHTVRYAEPVPLFREHFFFGELFQGICEIVDERRSNLFVVRGGNTTYQEITGSRSADGWIVVAPSIEDIDDLEAMQNSGIPFITIANSANMPQITPNLPYVEAANRDGARQAVEHLYSLGHRRIAHINHIISSGDCFSRYSGFLEALSERKLDLSPDHLLLYPMYSPDYFTMLLNNWILRLQKTDNLPTAVFAADYTAALGFLQAANNAGVKIPEDISLVGYDDPLSAAHLMPSLTTVRQPLFEMGRRAASRLLNHLAASQNQAVATPKMDEAEFLPVSLVVRSSTCPPKEAIHLSGASQ